ncbi:MAG: hypothetical protein ACFFDQ_00215 [Candidatus Thorarchaeota archaeon]
MTDESSRDRIFKAVKERIKEMDEKERIQLVANAIGDRRIKDLVDITARIESEDGWPTALEYLRKAKHQKYFSPLTIGQDRRNLEELKYREMVFELLSCKGLEPITTETTDLLKQLDDERSLIDASRSLLSEIEQLAVEQIETGDTLFFDFPEYTTVSQKIVMLLDQVRSENFSNISLKQTEDLINVGPLWYSEYGRLAMAALGIKGLFVNSDTLDHILSIMQISNSIKSSITKTTFSKQTNEESWSPPTNPVYKELHTSLINHDINELSLLASRHSILLLNTLLDEAITVYDKSPSTNGYKEILNCINAHISIRDIESITTLEKSSQMKNKRIATMAILALGTFYHESSTAVLVKLLCTNKGKATENVLVKAIGNVYKKCPEAEYVILNTLDSECKNHGKLMRTYKRFAKEKPSYY